MTIEREQHISMQLCFHIKSLLFLSCQSVNRSVPLKGKELIFCNYAQSYPQRKALSGQHLVEKFSKA